ADAEIRRADLRERLAERRQTVRRRMGRLEPVDLRADVDGAAVPLEPLASLLAFGCEPLGETGLLEEVALFGQLCFGGRPGLAGCGERIAILLQLREGRFAVALGGGLGGEIRLCRLDLAGILVALRVELVQGSLELAARPARATVGAGDRCLEAITE